MFTETERAIGFADELERIARGLRSGELQIDADDYSKDIQEGAPEGGFRTYHPTGGRHLDFHYSPSTERKE